MDESERWQKSLARQSSWPHVGNKSSDPSKSSHLTRSGFRRKSSSESQDGGRQEQSYHHTDSRTGEFLSTGVATSSNTEVPAHARSTTRPKTTPCVQEISQPTPINVIPTPPPGEQPSTTRPYVGGKYISTQSPAHTSSSQRSVKEHVILKYRPGYVKGCRTSEGAPTSPISLPAGLPPHLAVGGYVQPPTMAGNESMSEVAREEKQEDWITVSHEEVPSNIKGLHGYQQKSRAGKETALVATQHENDHLKKEIEQLSGRNAQLDFQLRQLQAKLHQEHSKVSSSQEQKPAHSLTQLDEVVKEKKHLEQKTIAQQAKIENAIQELVQSCRDVTQLTTEVEQLRREKADLLGEVEAHKLTALTFQEDFQQERKDREKAHSRVAEVEQRYQHQLQSLVAQLERTAQELDHTKKDAGIQIQQVAELESRNKELLKEKEKLFKELDKIRKELEKKAEAEKAKKEAEKVKREAKRKLSDKGAAPPDPTGVSMALEEKLAKNERLYETLRNKNEELAKEVSQLTTELEKLCREKTDFLEEVEAYKFKLAEKDDLLQAAQDEQLQLKQQTDRIIQSLQGENEDLRLQTYEKDQMIQSIQGENKVLRRQVSLGGRIQSQQAQQANKSEFWEVPREEVDLNMQKFLGTGAWGFVVEGTFRGQRVAVKCLHDMIRSPEFVEVMRKEIAIMAQVRHPNLVLLIAAVMDTKNDPLIVTELLDISLRKAYEKNCLQGSSKLNIFRDIASALNYLHLHQSGEIIHRDVSSSNVLLEAKPNNQWKAKLSDFGSAKLAMEAKSTAPGTPVYSAPEVRKEMGICQTAKLDVYSYGILLCEVTMEQFPAEESLPSMMKEVQGTWAFMHRLITSCVQDHPDRRPTMSYVLSEFHKIQPQK